MSSLSNSNRISVLNQIQHLLLIIQADTLQLRNLNLVIIVLLHNQGVLIIQKIKTFPPINLKETDCVTCFLLCILSSREIKHILNRRRLHSFHRKSLPATCLPIRKNSDNSLIEQTLNDWANHVIIKQRRVFMIPERVVELEIDGVDVLGDAVYFHFRFENSDLGVFGAHAVEVASGYFLFEDWSFSYANADSHVCDFLMRFGFAHIKPVFSDHFLIWLFALANIVCSHLSGLLSLFWFVLKHLLLLNLLSLFL